MSTPHPTREELAAFKAGRTSGSMPDRIAEHLEACSECRDLDEAVPPDSLARDVQAAVRAGAADRPDAPLHIPGFEVGDELGRGGMGVVYKARQHHLNRDVAVKVIPAAFPDPGQVARFQTESAIVGGLNHPNIVTAHLARADGVRPFIVMEYVAGGPLSKRPPERPREEAARVATIARAVAAAHAAGVIHRDLKPANILMAGDEPKVSDFGLAQPADRPDPAAAGGPRPGPGRTAAGQVLGTPEYMSPEQARGEPATVASDVYGLGAILYQRLTATAPFARKPPENASGVLERVRTGEVTPPRTIARGVGIPADLEAICLKCLEKNPSRRYPAAKDVADDLTRFLGGHPVVARPVGSRERVGKWVRRNPVVACLIAAVVVVGGTFGGVALGERGGRKQAEEVATDAGRGEARAVVAAALLHTSQAAIDGQHPGPHAQPEINRRQATRAARDAAREQLRRHLGKPWADVTEQIGRAIEAWRGRQPGLALDLARTDLLDAVPPDDPLHPLLGYHLYRVRGGACIDLKRWADGAGEFTEAVKFQPAAWPPRALKGLCELRAGRDVEAITSLETAVARLSTADVPGEPAADDETRSDLFASHGQVLLKAGRLDEAERALFRAADFCTRPGNRAAEGLSISLLKLGAAHGQSGRGERCIAATARGIDTGRGVPATGGDGRHEKALTDGYTVLAHWRHKLNRHAAALADYGELVTRHYDNAATKDALAHALSQRAICRLEWLRFSAKEQKRLREGGRTAAGATPLAGAKDYDEGLDRIVADTSRAVTIWQDLGEQAGVGEALTTRAFAYAAARRFDRADADLAAARAGFEQATASGEAAAARVEAGKLRLAAVEEECRRLRGRLTKS